ncbi:MAG: putative structural protein [Prokaryotic dsDNA virus sp.]|mgnify:CR=1 FL=1|nr:MAG: putative structural protein [Prokaryotic dsDNA virus sp.]|tara:strand:+ start:32019 stop:32438 length:420 start_codon:yes stop_codon:yes gene_type:complete
MQNYSFLNTVLLINGVEITGYDEGDDVIQLARLGDSASHIIGADGLMTVNLSADRSGEIIFRVQQTSDSNSYLSGLITAQENGIFVPIFAQFKDTRNNDLGSGTQGYIPRPADITRGTGMNSQEWRIVVERLDMLHLGG